MLSFLFIFISFLSISLFADNICFIERTPVEAVTTEHGWMLERDYDFVNGREAAFKEIIISGRVLANSKIPHIAGVNGDIVVRLALPSKASILKAHATITNFADTVTRRFVLSYSLDGIKYDTLDDKSSGPGSCKLLADLKLPDNSGVIFIKCSRVLEKNDDNGHHGFVLWGRLGFTVTGDSDSKLSAKQTQTLALKDAFPTGAFWAWERTAPCAAYAKKELWEFVDSQMELLSANGYDTLWFVNIGTSDMQKVLKVAERNNMRVLLNTGLLDAVYSGAGSLANLERTAWNSYKNIGGSKALLGYVGKDEPLLCDTENMSTFYRLMKDVDPNRDLIVCTMNRQTLTYIRDTPMPVACSDLYYFGSEKSTQLAQPHESQPELTNALESFCLAAREHGKHFWFFGQMFGDVWGRHWRRGDRLVVEPGAYLHWKMPTDAEARWQIWEALRLGAKGMLFYVLQPPIQLEVPPAQATAAWQLKRVKSMDSLAATAASWKDQPLVSKEIEIDAGEGMIDMDGTPRPQLLATAPAMRLIRKYEKLLLARDFASVPVFFPGDSVTDVNTFESQGRLIGVIVNRDLHNSHDARVLLPYNVQSVLNLETGATIKADVVDGDFKAFNINLPAGGGALLEAKTSGRPGICICKEDFGRQTFLRVNVGNNATVERFGNYGADSRFVLKLKEKMLDVNAPVCILPRLTNLKSSVRTVAMNLNSSRKDGTIFCWLKGRVTKCRTVAVAEDSNGENENFMHLKDAGSYTVAPSGKGLVIQSGVFQHPVTVPHGTASLEFFLDSPDDYISEIRLWFVP